MDFVIYILVLLATFYFLAKIVDIYFVESLEIISKKLKLSSDIAGATFMAIGSSAPELFASMLAIFKTTSEGQSIGAGTIVGSAIFNILVIIGVSAMFKRAYLTWQPVIRDLTFYIFSIILLLFTFQDGQITPLEAIMFVGFYIIYLFSFGIWKKLLPYKTKGDEVDFTPDEENKPQNFIDKLISLFFVNLRKYPKYYLVNFLISILFIGLLSHAMVESAVHIAEIINIPSVIVSLTILAAGTSIPDLLASINVAKSGRGDMAISNAVGSNIFDIAIGLGLPWVIATIFMGKEIQVATENLNSSIVLLFATVVALLFILIVRKWEIGRWGGLLLILIYIGYLGYQIINIV